MSIEHVGGCGFLVFLFCFIFVCFFLALVVFEWRYSFWLVFMKDGRTCGQAGQRRTRAYAWEARGRRGDPEWSQYLHPTTHQQEEEKIQEEVLDSVSVCVTGPLALRTWTRHRGICRMLQRSRCLSFFLPFLSDDCGSTSPTANMEVVCDD